MLQLKDGSTHLDARADRLPEYDARNKDFPISALLGDQGKKPRLRSYTWRVRHVLDQGIDGACVGFAWAHELIARPGEVARIDESFAREKLYLEAQKRDHWPGGEYPGASPILAGTSVLACAKVVTDLGYIKEYRWAENLFDLAGAVGFIGPAVLGCALFADMRAPDPEGFIRPTGSRIGGHAFLITGVSIRTTPVGSVDQDDSTFLLQNSWGTDWGLRGTCRITFNHLLRLWDGAEFCVPLNRRAI